MKLYDWLELIVLRGQARIGEYLAFSIVIRFGFIITEIYVVERSSGRKGRQKGTMLREDMGTRFRLKR